MTVAELIAKLQGMPQEARVVIDGYEGGLDDLKTVELIEMVVDSKECYGGLFGPHEQWYPPVVDPRGSNPPHETAVYLPRYLTPTSVGVRPV